MSSKVNIVLSLLTRLYILATYIYNSGLIPTLKYNASIYSGNKVPILASLF